MKIRKFRIYLADLNLRFGAEPGKTRPFVVVQTDLLNTVHFSTIIYPLTTNVFPNAAKIRVRLKASECGLGADSDILVDQVHSILRFWNKALFMIDRLA